MSDISNLDKDFGSKWFGVANLGGRDYLDLTIQNVWIETMQDGEEKIAVNFRNEESGKAMLFNKVIYKTMRKIAGTDNGLAWIDKTIRVFRTTADYQGTTHDVLRIRAVPPQKSSAAPAVSAAPATSAPRREANQEEPTGLPERRDDAGREGEGGDDL